VQLLYQRIWFTFIASAARSRRAAPAAEHLRAEILTDGDLHDRRDRRPFRAAHRQPALLLAGRSLAFTAALGLGMVGRGGVHVWMLFVPIALLAESATG
jgi:hypothetical protein